LSCEPGGMTQKHACSGESVSAISLASRFLQDVLISN
jgi:hypothetical protein